MSKERPWEGADLGNPHRPPPRATGTRGQRCQVIRLFQRKPAIKILRELAPLQKEKVCVSQRKHVCEPEQAFEDSRLQPLLR